jgi:hypothetical protein
MAAGLFRFTVFYLRATFPMTFAILMTATLCARPVVCPMHWITERNARHAGPLCYEPASFLAGIINRVAVPIGRQRFSKLVICRDDLSECRAQVLGLGQNLSAAFLD